MKAPVFSRNAVVWLVTVCAVSLLVGMLLGVFRSDLARFRSAGADSFSRSAIGHRAFVELLQELEVPVLVSLDESAEKAGVDNALLLLEPSLSDTGGPAFPFWEESYADAFQILLVLPKWRGVVDPRRPGWLSAAVIHPVERIEGLLDSLNLNAALVRPEADELGEWDILEGLEPELNAPQLLRSDSLKTIWSCEKGTLLAQWIVDPNIEETILVLSDPDLISNHGLGLGDNAELAVSVVRSLAGANGAVIFDETVHGFRVTRSLWRGFFEFPLVLVTVQMTLVAASLLWLAVLRFGSARPPREGHSPGQGFLIANTAQLLCYGGHGPRVLSRYWEFIRQEVAERLHLDRRTTDDRIYERMDRISRARGTTHRPEDLDQRVRRLGEKSEPSAEALPALAGDIHKWHREMTHGL